MAVAAGLHALAAERRRALYLPATGGRRLIQLLRDWGADLLSIDSPYKTRNGALFHMDARNVRYMETPAEVRGYNAMVWRNAAFFLLTSYGLSVVSAPSFAREEVITQYLFWLVAASLAAAPIVDVAAMVFGVVSVRSLAARAVMMELLAVSPVTTEQIYRSRLGAAWLRTWRLLVVMVAVRGALVALIVLYIVAFLEGALGAWLLALPPVAWAYLWWPMRRARAMTGLGVRAAMTHRSNWRAMISLFGGAIIYTLLTAFMVGLFAYGYALMDGLFAGQASWTRFLVLWAFPFASNGFHSRFLANNLRDTEIHSAWDQLE